LPTAFAAWPPCFGSIQTKEVRRISYGTSENEREDVVAVKPDSTMRTPEAVLRSFIYRLGPKDQKLIRSVRAAVRKRFSTANELAYDYASHFVIAYSPTDRGIDSVVSIVARANGVQLCFTQGKRLPDPKRLLLGSGNQTRFVWVEAATQLAHPDVKALIAAAIDQASVPLPSKGRGGLIIRPTAASRRSVRRPKK
jgi:hypothetical protein